MPARTDPADARPTRARPAKPRRGQGQWALGYREPLNPNERSKRDDDPLNVRQRILDIYSVQRLRQHRPRRPARPLPLDGALHAAA